MRLRDREDAHRDPFCGPRAGETRDPCAAHRRSRRRRRWISRLRSREKTPAPRPPRRGGDQLALPFSTIRYHAAGNATSQIFAARKNALPIGPGASTMAAITPILGTGAIRSSAMRASRREVRAGEACSPSSRVSLFTSAPFFPFSLSRPLPLTHSQPQIPGIPRMRFGSGQSSRNLALSDGAATPG